MPTASWNGAVIAQATDAQVQVVENNVYFPLSSVTQEYLRPSSHTSICPWKGTASYYDLVVDGQTNANAAWYYPQPKDAAKQIAGHVAFWRGVSVER
ncbi:MULTISPECIES: DUF427 domain-containing protein [Janthinobacterium]|jgi:uncharacterized protein (DUF427 family)|uniref:DUF427 domain-containing protein n=1 Tax=Janthinobacterium TaxID=29580 RepID=UPI000537284E|nr:MULTISPECIES: DUF427 domain-containing protein [Janthinobacterium]KHA79580.1 hypothetical protein NC77_05185 [Janthinobacterium lividum]MCC7713789.1 DUF427 domain-containing protein [Janthinobacterium lividum]MDO8035101.1 DUF427 domain-containing protein [Janthinobacterium sp. SUN128]OEZ61901.1 hypothetical protein JANLI_11290 [Janthinobacterium lividum]WQE28264.1 DUF427 domain-containing protein [Janthinobacterium lividum]